MDWVYSGRMTVSEPSARPGWNVCSVAGLPDLKGHRPPLTNHIFIHSCFFFLPRLSPLPSFFPTSKYLNSSGLKFFYWNEEEDGWMDGRTDGWMNGQIDGWMMDGSVDRWINRCMDGWTDGKWIKMYFSYLLFLKTIIRS